MPLNSNSSAFFLKSIRFLKRTNYEVWRSDDQQVCQIFGFLPRIMLTPTIEIDDPLFNTSVRNTQKSAKISIKGTSVVFDLSHCFEYVDDLFFGQKLTVLFAQCVG